MDEVDSSIGEIWRFPEIEVLPVDIAPPLPEPAPALPEDTLEMSTDIPEAEVPADNTGDMQLRELEENLRNQALFLDTIGFEMRQTLEGFDHELYHQIISIVQKVTRKIIHREIALDPETLKTMVDEAMARINSENTACTLHVAPDDKTLFDAVYEGTHVSISVDETLTRGDFRIKTAHSALISSIDARIHALLGLEAG